MNLSTVKGARSEGEVFFNWTQTDGFGINSYRENLRGFKRSFVGYVEEMRMEEKNKETL